jgi:hypothetical protein
VHIIELALLSQVIFLNQSIITIYLKNVTFPLMEYAPNNGWNELLYPQQDFSYKESLHSYHYELDLFSKISCILKYTITL